MKSNEHRIGIEMEFLLLNQDDLSLKDEAETLFALLENKDGISQESFQSCIEIKTPPSHTIDQAQKEIEERLQRLKPHLTHLGLNLCALGLHPTHLGISQTTNEQRYLSFATEYPFITRHHLICSNHVHTSMSSLQETLNVMNRLRPLLPLFVVLSASCPFWHGEPTGFVSFRQYLQRGGLNCGLPPHLEREEDFWHYYSTAKKAGIIQTLKDIHWDIRPRPDLHTLELRCMDAVPSLDEAMALAAFAHCLMIYLKEHTIDFIRPPSWGESINYFQAAHLGIEAPFITDSAGPVRSIKEMIKIVLEILTPVAANLDALEHLQRIKKMMETGLPYQQIQTLYQKGLSLEQVLRTKVITGLDYNDLPPAHQCVRALELMSDLDSQTSHRK